MRLILRFKPRNKQLVFSWSVFFCFFFKSVKSGPNKLTLIYFACILCPEELHTLHHKMITFGETCLHFLSHAAISVEIYKKDDLYLCIRLDLFVIALTCGLKTIEAVIHRLRDVGSLLSLLDLYLQLFQ